VKFALLLITFTYVSELPGDANRRGFDITEPD
jgi:hypothetical protein